MGFSDAIETRQGGSERCAPSHTLIREAGQPCNHGRRNGPSVMWYWRRHPAGRLVARAFNATRGLRLCAGDTATLTTRVSSFRGV